MVQASAPDPGAARGVVFVGPVAEVTVNRRTGHARTINPSDHPPTGRATRGATDRASVRKAVVSGDVGATSSSDTPRRHALSVASRSSGNCAVTDAR